MSTRQMESNSSRPGMPTSIKRRRRMGCLVTDPTPLTTPMIKKWKVRRAPRSSEVPALHLPKKDKNTRFTIGRTEAGATTASREELWGSLTVP